MHIIRTIEGGGSGFRRVDLTVDGHKFVIQSEPVFPKSEITTVDGLLQFVTQDLLPNTCGIAYSVAALIKDHSLVVNSPNIQFLNGVDLGLITREIAGLPVYVANDMEAATIGIYVMLGLSGLLFLNNFVAITWSSGIGVRFCVDGRVVFGSEAGHMLSDRSSSSRMCGCGKRGCFESIIGGKAIEKWLPSELFSEGIAFYNNRHIMAVLDDEYQAGNQKAIGAYRKIAAEMGIFLAQLKQVNTDFTAVVWKGTLATKSLSLPGIVEMIRESMRDHLMDPNMESEVLFHLVSNYQGKVRDSESFYGCARLLDGLLV